MLKMFSLTTAIWFAGSTASRAAGSFLDPAGPVARSERDLMVTAVLLMLIVAIPVFVMLFGFAWRYRASRANARYTPDWAQSRVVDSIVWLVPAVIVVAIASLVWIRTHHLDPYREVPSGAAPFPVEVVARDWDWLFIYPEQRLATLNELAFPLGRPLQLRITSDTVMNSFMIPALGGQIYAMAGMETKLNLLADRAGQFTGRNYQYSGDGFPLQTFAANALDEDSFAAWVRDARTKASPLDMQAYRQLATTDAGGSVRYFTPTSGLFDRIIESYDHGTPGTNHVLARD